MAPAIGVVTFPGSQDDQDALRAVRLAGASAVPLWHRDPSLHGVDAVVLPGALIRNGGMLFINRDERLRVESASTVWTADYAPGQEIVIPIKNGEGRYTADERTLDALEAEGRIVARYLDNPNGSARDIAGIANAEGNVVGLMPHPEHAVEELTGPYPGPATDGLPFFTSILKHLVSVSA